MERQKSAGESTQRQTCWSKAGRTFQTLPAVSGWPFSPNSCTLSPTHPLPLPCLQTSTQLLPSSYLGSSDKVCCSQVGGGTFSSHPLLVAFRPAGTAPFLKRKSTESPRTQAPSESQATCRNSHGLGAEPVLGRESQTDILGGGAHQNEVPDSTHGLPACPSQMECFS